MAHRVVLLPAAEADLDAIDEYIAEDSPLNAVAFVRRIRTRCNQLSDFPERGTLRHDLEPGIRTLAFERRVLIVFRVLSEEVEIVRIFYGGREIERAFIQGQ